MNRPGLATLKQIAAATGVHTSTVSRALDPHKRHLVADDVAERIVQLAQSLGYQPNRVATSLRTGRSHLIGVLLPDIANPVFARFSAASPKRWRAKAMRRSLPMPATTPRSK